MIKFTIITVCYNAEKTIKRTVESVLQQTYPSIEYLVIDGASTDNTLNILKAYSENSIIKVYSEKDYGIYNAMNRGIARADGDYILFLNADDTLYNSRVLEDVAVYIKDKKEAIYYGGICRVSENRPNMIVDFDDAEGSIKSKLLKGDMPCHQAIVASTCLLRNHYFREKYEIRADYEWLIYSLSKGVEFISIPTVISNFNDSGISGAVHSLEQMQVETQDIIKDYASYFQKAVDFEEFTFEWKQMSDKHLGMFLLMNCWMKRKREGFDLGNFLKMKNIHTIAIYGMGYLGKNLLDELADSDIEVRYAIDKNAANINAGITVYTPNEQLELVDAVIVTTITNFSEISNVLKEQIDSLILPLENILYDNSV